MTSFSSSKLTFSTYFRNTIREKFSLDPDQDLRYVRPDMGPKCLQRLSAVAKFVASKERVKKACVGLVFHDK